MSQQCEHLHARQKVFDEILESQPVFALQDAYTFDTRARATFTDGFMVRTHTKTGRQLFDSIDMAQGQLIG
jgi:hypothetical protein